MQQQRSRSCTASHCCYQGHGFSSKNQDWDQRRSTRQPSPPPEESKAQPIWQPALSFRNELSRLESWEQPAGSFPKSPVTKQLAEALREEICSAATGQVATTQSLPVHLRQPACPGRNADSTPKASPSQSTPSLPRQLNRYYDQILQYH